MSKTAAMSTSYIDKGRTILLASLLKSCSRFHNLEIKISYLQQKTVVKLVLVKSVVNS